MVMLALALGCESEKSWFEESDYLLESIEGRELAPGSRIELRFYGRELSAYAGCEGMSAAYWRADGAIVVGDEVADSDFSVSCGIAVDDQEEWMKRFLNETPSYEIDGPRLTLTDDVVTIVLLDEEVADPDRPLVGPTWEIEGIVDSGLVMGVEHGEGTITFGAGVQRVIDGPCASGAADYVADDALLIFEQVAIDPPVCPGDEVGQSIDAHLRELLVEGPLSFEIDTSRLTIGGAELGLVLRTD